VKDPLEERTEELANHLLSNPVTHGGDTQRTGFTVAFGDVDTSERMGLVCPILQASHESQQVLFEIIGEQFDADLVDPSGPSVAFDATEGVLHHCWGDPPRQRMCFDLLGQR
jgi:hypothetical protein